MAVSSKPTSRRSPKRKHSKSGKSASQTTTGGWNPYARYTSPEMQQLFCERNRHLLWRRLWLSLAKHQSKLGLKIQAKQIREMASALEQIDYARVADLERKRRHDVMAHVQAYGEVAPAAKGIIHLGATSCFVTDNSDLIIYRDALHLVRDKALGLAHALERFALLHADLPILGYTHFQVALPTTVGKRASLWLQDLMLDLEAILFCDAQIHFRGLKGATGTQDGFLRLFNQSRRKVDELERCVARDFGFKTSFPVAGQTYSRKLDYLIQATLAGLGVSLSKWAHDMRLLQHLDEMGEGFGENQIGSSAMPFKQNPMKAERLTGLARFLMGLPLNGAFTAGTQWLERSLDDSANRRIVMSQAFFAADACLNVAHEVVGSMGIHRAVIQKNLERWLPFLATESFIMEGVKRGGDRQQLHETIRRVMVQSRAAERDGKPVNFFEELRQQSDFTWLTARDLPAAKDLVGLAPAQTRRYCSSVRQRLAQIERVNRAKPKSASPLQV